MKKISLQAAAAALMAASMTLTACTDYFEVPTTATLTAEDAQKVSQANPDALINVVNGVYNVLVQYDLYSTNHDAFGLMAILHATDMMSGDIVMMRSSHFIYDYTHDNREWNYRRTSMIWLYLYTAVSTANSVIDQVGAAPTDPVAKAIKGQALALRGMAYYYLVQLYQHVYPVSASGSRPAVPLRYAVTDAKPDIESRASVGDVLAQVEADLTAASELLQGWERQNKNQMDYYVAQGFLARYYLLTEQWDKARAAAQHVLDEYDVMPATQITDGFMDINNDEWMWGFDHTAETTTLYASFFSHMSNTTAGYSGIEYSTRLIDKRLFDQIPANDARRSWFQVVSSDTLVRASTGVRDSVVARRSAPDPQPRAGNATGWRNHLAALKFGYDPNFTMDYLYMRASEMVLVVAESYAQQGNNTAAATALKQLMEKRVEGWNQTSVTLEDVKLQRRIELWGEGHAYFDLKRWNEGIDRTYDGTNHLSQARIIVNALDKKWIYRLPQSEIQENPQISEADNNE